MKIYLNYTFWVSTGLCLIFIIYGIFAPENFNTNTKFLMNLITVHFGWYYLIFVFTILLLCFYLLLSKYRNITLGKEGEEPEFSFNSWFTMMFSAGMGMGLVFWTTIEPLSDSFKNAPVYKNGSHLAIEHSLQYSFFHWGIHAWAVYCIVALIFAYFSFHKGYPGLVSSTLSPLLGNGNLQKYVGGTSDILAVIATVTGVSATLGFGTSQINQGMHFLFNVPSNLLVQTLIIIISAMIYTYSAWSGINKGIKFLSNINIWLAFIILISLFCVGPTLYILNIFIDALGNYFFSIY